MPNHWTPVPDKEMRPKGPDDAFEQAVALLAPFALQFADHAPVDAREALQTLEPRLAAQGFVHNLAEDLNRSLYRARHAPRLKDMVARLEQTRDLLRDTNSAISSLDEWSRFYLRSRSELYHGGVEPRWLPSYENSNHGNFVELSSALAEQIDEVISDLRESFGDGQVADRGGAHSHEERFLGSAKIRFVRDAFDVFDSYHPGSASSSEGSPFFTFIHKVYEFATGEYDEDRMALSYKLRELITPLHRQKKTKTAYWAIEKKLADNVPANRDERQLREQQSKLRKELSQLETNFIPALDRVRKAQPRQKKSR